MHSTLVMQNTSIGDVQSRYEADLGYSKVTMKDSNPNSGDGFGNGSYHKNYEDKDHDKMATPPSHTNVEDSLSKGLLKLSLNDRNAMEEEIHGVRCLGVTKETPELLQRSLQEFDKELMAIKNNPSRIASIKKTAGVRRRSSKSSSQTPPIDVLKNVIDTTKQDTTIINNANANENTNINATAKHQCYLNDLDVRLRFLRCESFDAKASAKRFVRFFELAKEVFGDFVAERPIRLSDFFEAPDGGRLRRYQQHEKKTLSSSKIQYLPFRDRSGRRVKVGVGDCNAELDLMLRIKINLLMDWIASEDVETQQKGVVIVVWPFDPSTTSATTTTTTNNKAAAGYNSSSSSNNPTSGSSGCSSCSEGEDDTRNWEGFLRPKYSRNDMVYHNRYYQAQPLRVAAVHWCSQDKPIYRVLNNLYYFSLDSKTQSRYKVHFGEPLEIRYQLQAFGIPVDLLPLTHTMALKRQHHSQWMSSRRHIEEQRKQEQQQKQHEYQQQTYQQQQFQRQQQHFQQQQQQQQQFLRQNLLKQPLDDELAMQFFESAASSTSGMQQGGSSNKGQPMVVECPRSYDVIIGKAKVCTNNPGNGFYSSLIEATHDEHDSLDHARDKVAMTWRILLYITEERKGRFLDWNKSLNAWVVIQDRIVIRKKIANSYKEYKRSRYVTTRSPKSSKKKQASDDVKQESTGGSTATALNRSNHNIYAANSKRQKISGCLENGSDGDGIMQQTESIFAAL